MELVGFLFSFIIALQFSIGLAEISFLLPSAELVVSASDQNNENGLVIKRIDDNVTLTCNLVIRDNSIISDKNIELIWMMPLQSVNRSRKIWTEKNSIKLFLDYLQPSDAGNYTCVTSLLPISKAELYVAVIPPNLLGVSLCSSSMFSCDIPQDKKGARCISKIFLCDGRPDCPAPSRDEDPEICGTSDPCAGKLRCNDGRCIPKELCCDGRWNCLPHSCCVQHKDEEYPIEKVGGGLKKNTKEQLLLQVTLYKACVCFFVIVTFFIVIIFAICRARIKRISNRHIETQSPEPLEIGPCSTSIPRRFSLICHNDLDVVNSRFPPSYSDLVIENNHVSSSEHVPNSSSETDTNGQSNTLDNLETRSSPARRPNDFGMGFIANAIFNSRYRPVPQNLEVTSLDYGTDSDSSCRSPALTAPNPMNEFNSHFYGERIGGTPDLFSESRRARHSNALDRILDRFGLNAPYNVDIDRLDRSTWERESFLSPPDYDQHLRRPFPYMHSFWSRLKDMFNRSDVDRTDGSVANNNDLSASGRRRRRPDTPDVPEPNLNDRNFSQMRYFQQRGCFMGRDVRLVPPHNFPPPYTQYAPDPPPPYVSRENLLNNNVSSDQNGNSIVEESDIVVSNDAAVVAAPPTEPAVALNSCDDNGNSKIEEASTSSSIREREESITDQKAVSVQSREVNANDVAITVESNRPTEDCGLTFPPSNLEFIDSDSILEHSVDA